MRSADRPGSTVGTPDGPRAHPAALTTRCGCGCADADAAAACTARQAVAVDIGLVRKVLSAHIGVAGAVALVERIRFRPSGEPMQRMDCLQHEYSQ